MALAIPNEILLYGSPAIGLFSIFPLYIALYRSKSYKEAFFLFFLQSAFCHLISSYWLGNFEGFAAFTLGASDIGTGVICGISGLITFVPVLFTSKEAKLKQLCGARTGMIPFRAVWFSAIYVFYEWTKSTGFLAYPWGTVSMTAYKWPLVTQIADITGVWGITFLFVFTSSILGEAVLLLGSISSSFFQKDQINALKATLRCCTALFAVTVLYGLYQYNLERTPVKTMNTVLVQQNNDAWRRFEEENINISQELSAQGMDFIEQSMGENTDLVVWSEAVLSKRFPNAEMYYKYFPDPDPLLKFIKRNGVPHIIGGPYILDADKSDFGNGALLFDKAGKFRGTYIKIHLVPFAELIPGRQYEFIRNIVKKIAGSYGWAPGKKVVLFEIPLESPQPEIDNAVELISIANPRKNLEKPSVILSTPICFDDSALEVCRAMFLSGSEVFVNLTNDSWSRTRSAEIQHFVVAHYRSIEFRSTMIRATNAGYTTVISPAGKVEASLPLFTRDYLAYKVPVYKRSITIFARFGNWLPLSILVLAAGWTFILYRKEIEKQKSEKDISLHCIHHSIEWYDTYDFIMSIFDKVYAIDWNNWNC